MAETHTTRFPHQVEHVGRTGIYPASGPLPPGDAEVRGQGELGHPEEHRALRATALEQTERRAALMFGRAIFGGFFLCSGLKHFAGAEALRGYARSKGVPMPEVAVAASGALMVLGGLSLLTGVKPRIGAAMMALIGGAALAAAIPEPWPASVPISRAPIGPGGIS